MRQSNISLYILSITFSLLSLNLYGQETKNQSKRQNKFEISSDILGIVQELTSSYGQYQISTRYNIHNKSFPILEFGLGMSDHTDGGTGLHYKVKSPYGRIGIDFNLLKDKQSPYRFYLGGRFAFSSFKYDFQSPAIIDPTWGYITKIDNDGIKGQYIWAELVAGVQTKIAGPFQMGWNIRYKRRLYQKAGETGDPWYVPGFGKRGASRLGGEFNIVLVL